MDAFSQWQTALLHLNKATLSFIDASSNLRMALLRDLVVPGKKSFIDGMLVEIKSHQASIKAIETNLQRAKAVMDRIFNLSTTLPPISALPDEVLCHIFNIAMILPSPSSPSGRRPYKERNTVLDISSICSRWRQLAIQTPSLWSHIDLQNLRKVNPEKSRPLDLMKLWLERSSGFPLHLTLPHGSINPWQAGQLVSALQPYSASISSIISHKIWDALLIQELCTLCTACGSLDSVKTLVFIAQSETAIKPLVTWQLVASFTGLVDFELSRLPSAAHPTSYQIAAILASNPFIRRLRLRSMAILPETGPPKPAIVLPHLQMLDVLDLEGLSWLMRILLPGALELDLRLSRHHCHPDNSAVLSRFLHRAHVVSLWISDLRSDSSIVWLPVLPAVRVLGLIAWGNNFSFVDHLVIPNGEAIVAKYPTVRSMCLSGSGSLDLSGRARVEKMVECYSLDLLNFDRPTVSLLYPGELLTGREVGMDAFLRRRVGRLTWKEVSLREIDQLDNYVQALIKNTVSS
ncbi:hypothetical protein FRC12_002906 [Ceratobasidium sp. 428]|nr:hypothetical protein FRC12_002906 [Ceratobasidium sp. 428]